MTVIRAALLLAAAVALTVAPGCDRPSTSGADGGSAPSDTGTSIVAGTPCASLSRLSCAKSSRCFLDHVSSSPPRYLCRDKKGPCEEGINQWDKRACLAKPGCEHLEGSCYCPFPGYGETAVPDEVDAKRGGACACGGGPPPRCVVKGSVPAASGSVSP